MHISASGMKVNEPACDLPAEMLITESYINSGPPTFWKRQAQKQRRYWTLWSIHLLYQITGLLEVYVKRQTDSMFQADYSLALHRVCTTMKFQMQQVRDNKECLTVGQGPPSEWGPDFTSHLPHYLYIFSHHCLNTSCGAKTRRMSLHMQLSTTATRCSAFFCSFMLFSLCNMAELSHGLSKDPYPEKDCWVRIRYTSQKWRSCITETL